jgi:hypothetical protein
MGNASGKLSYGLSLLDGKPGFQEFSALLHLFQES